MNKLGDPASRASWRALLGMLVLTVSILFPGTPEASAAWMLSGSGPGDAKASSVPALAGPPQATRTLMVATVSWTATPVGSGSATGYVVRRYNGTTESQITGGTCVGTTVNGVPNVVASTSCTDDRGVTVGTFTYTVQPVFQKWKGPASSTSTPAV